MASSGEERSDVDARLAAARLRQGTFDWLRKANDPQSRRARLGLARETQEAAARGWYWRGSERVDLHAADEAEAGTRILSPSQGSGAWPALPEEPPHTTTTCHRVEAERTVLDCAVAQSLQGRRVAVVSAASAYHVGGGFATGGRHALEEAVCMQTTLFRCLQHASRLAGSSQGSPYIPTDGAVYSPRVEVFRHDWHSGYSPMEKPVELACLVSVAMPNQNSRVRDAPVDVIKPMDYLEVLRSKWRAALHAACVAKASDVVCPDAGCGVYQNQPEAVGAALGAVLQSEYEGHIENVWLCGSSAFAAAVQAALSPGSPTWPLQLAGEDSGKVTPLSEGNLRRWLRKSFYSGGVESRSGQSRTLASKSSACRSTTLSSRSSRASARSTDEDVESRAPSAKSGAAAAAQGREGAPAAGGSGPSPAVGAAPVEQPRRRQQAPARPRTRAVADTGAARGIAAAPAAQARRLAGRADGPGGGVRPPPEDPVVASSVEPLGRQESGPPKELLPSFNERPGADFAFGLAALAWPLPPEDAHGELAVHAVPSCSRYAGPGRQLKEPRPCLVAL